MTPRFARAWSALAAGALQADWTPGSAARTNLRRRRVFTVSLLVALAITLSITWLRPPEYRASARLEIKPAVEALPPTAASGTVVVAATPGTESTRPFLTQVQVLTSRPILELAVAEVERSGERLAVPGEDPIASVQSRIEAVPVTGTNVVELFAVGPSPAPIASLLNAIIDVYRAQLADAYRDASNTAMAQINDEVAKLEHAVAAKRRNVEAFRIRHNIISLERQENEALAQVRNLSASLNNANERVATADGKLRALREALAEGRSSTPAKDDPTLAHLELRAAQMREQLTELERGYTPQYLEREPKVISLRARLAELERDIVAQREAGRKMALAKAQEELAAAQGALSRLQGQIAAGRQEASQFTTQFNEYKLQQESLNDLEAAYRDAVQRRARLEASTRARMPTLGVVEPATPPQQAWRPLYYRDSGIAVGASLLVALLVMGVVELFNRAEATPAVLVVQPQPVAGPYGGASGALGVERAPLLGGNGAPALLAAQPALPRELKQEEITALLLASDDETRLIVLLLFSGLSVDEALSVRWADIDTDARRIHVRGESARDLVAGGGLAALSSAQTEGRPREREAPVIGSDGGKALESVNARLLCAAHDAGLENASEVTAECLRHTYVAYLVRSRLRFADLARVVGRLPTEALRAYSALSPSGARVALDAIDVVHPALRDLAAERQ